MNYWRELIKNWRPLLAATIGTGTGMSLAGAIDSALAKHLIAGNHWKPEDYAAVGLLGIFSSIVFPFIGRLADVLGVRLTALIGQVTLPIAYFAYSRMSGSLTEYKIIFVVTGMICVTTTATVYSRLAVQYTQAARGLALAIVVSGGAIGSMIMGPILNHYVEANGWRASYQALAVFAAIAGLITFLLIPSSSKPAGQLTKRYSAMKDYPLIFKSRAFWILGVSMFLCNLPFTLALRQTKLVMEANGVSGEQAGIMLAALPFGMLIGRIFAGFMVDRIKPHLVGFVMMAIPSLGMFVIASPLDGLWVLTAAVMAIGFAFGAEGDVVAYLIARHFGVRIYSSVSGLITAIISLGVSLGAQLLSFIMAGGGGYNQFLISTGTCVLVGATLLLLLGREAVAEHADDEAEALA